MGRADGLKRYPALAHYLKERRDHGQNCWEKTLESIEQPHCVIWGMIDSVAVAARAHRVEERCPHPRPDKLEDVGHQPQLEVPQRVGQLLLGFILLGA
jgi:pimeloyl-ACP methyl ester carboxylesterase